MEWTFVKTSFLVFGSDTESKKDENSKLNFLDYNNSRMKRKNMISDICHFLQESVLKFMSLTYPHV